MSSLPKTIYIIRHCDKDAKCGDGCSEQGYQRALLLAGLNGSCKTKINTCNNSCSGTFDPSKPGYFPKLLGPDVKPILLSPISKLDSASKGINAKCTSSNRCCLILNPLAYYYKTQINPNNELFSDTEPKAVTDYIITHPELYANQTLIISYEHNAIPNMINAFGISPQLPPWPKSANDRFDLVFKLTFNEGSSVPIMNIFSQQLFTSDDHTNPFSPGGKQDIIEPFVNYNTRKQINSTVKPSKKNKSYIWIIFTMLIILAIVYFIFFRKDNLVKN